MLQILPVVEVDLKDGTGMISRKYIGGHYFVRLVDNYISHNAQYHFYTAARKRKDGDLPDHVTSLLYEPYNLSNRSSCLQPRFCAHSMMKPNSYPVCYVASNDQAAISHVWWEKGEKTLTLDPNPAASSLEQWVKILHDKHQFVE